MKKYCDNEKRLYKKEKIKKITLHKQAEGVHVSSIVNEGIRVLLNLFIFFTRRFHTHKKHKTHTSKQTKKKSSIFMLIKSI